MQRITSIFVCLAAVTFTANARAQHQDTSANAARQTTAVEHSTHTTATGNVAVSGHHHPKGATAKCTDGTYSMSESGADSCSGHGGVAKWYATARCTDGTLWMHTSKRGACASHQGVAEWLKTNKSTK